MRKNRILICFLLLIVSIISLKLCFHNEKEIVSAEILWNDRGKFEAVDECRNIWGFYGSGYNRGDKVKLLIDTNGTSYKGDDVVVDIVY